MVKISYIKMHGGAISQYEFELKIAILEQRRKLEDINPILQDKTDTLRTIYVFPGFQGLTHEIAGFRDAFEP